MAGYVGLKILFDAVKAAGNVDVEEVRAAVAKMDRAEGSAAEQLPQTDRWKTFLDHVVAKITRPLPPWIPPDRLELAG